MPPDDEGELGGSMSARCEAAVSPERAGAPGARSRLAAVLAVIALLGAALWLVPRAAGAVRAGATISGTVTRGDKSGIAGIEVTAYPEGSPRPLPAVFTAADGTYILTGLAAGSYKLRFFDPGGRFVAEFYDNRPSLSAADPVAVEAGAVVTGIDARLASFGTASTVGSGAAARPRGRTAGTPSTVCSRATTASGSLIRRVSTSPSITTTLVRCRRRPTSPFNLPVSPSMWMPPSTFPAAFSGRSETPRGGEWAASE